MWLWVISIIAGRFEVIAGTTEAAVELSGGMICAQRDDSAVEVAVDLTHGTKILKVRNLDILPSNLDYIHSIHAAPNY